LSFPNYLLTVPPFGRYDKGVLAEILEPIMGKGLIPADPVTWKTRRRAIVPGFHSRWLNRMVQLFSDCSSCLVEKLDKVGHSHDSIIVGRVITIGIGISVTAIYDRLSKRWVGCGIQKKIMPSADCHPAAAVIIRRRWRARWWTWRRSSAQSSCHKRLTRI
jgi:hypothetical protein